MQRLRVNLAKCSRSVTSRWTNCPLSFTFVIVGRQKALQAQTTVRNPLNIALALSGLIAACAAMAIPGWQAEVAEISAILAVGSIALLAGHLWGVLIIGIADLMMLSELWPIVAFDSWSSTSVQVAACTALACAIPGLVLLPTTIPRTFDLLFGVGGGRRRQAGVALCSIATVLWLAAPAYQHLTAPAPFRAAQAAAADQARAAAAHAAVEEARAVAVVEPHPDVAPKPQDDEALGDHVSEP